MRDDLAVLHPRRERTALSQSAGRYVEATKFTALSGHLPLFVLITGETVMPRRYRKHVDIAANGDRRDVEIRAPSRARFNSDQGKRVIGIEHDSGQTLSLGQMHHHVLPDGCEAAGRQRQESSTGRELSVC